MDQTFKFTSKNQDLKKHRLWTRYIETRDIKIFSKYKSARNAVCREIIKINREQQQEVAAQCKENLKKFLEIH